MTEANYQRKKLVIGLALAVMEAMHRDFSDANDPLWSAAQHVYVLHRWNVSLNDLRESLTAQGATMVAEHEDPYGEGAGPRLLWAVTHQVINSVW